MNRSAILVVAALILVGFLVYTQSSQQPADVRSSINAGIEKAKESTSLDANEEELLRLQLALADFTASKGEPPNSLDQLVPKYFDEVPKNPNTGESYQYDRRGVGYSLGVQAATVTAKKKKKDDAISSAVLGPGFVNPNDMKLVSFTYDPTDRRDPFRPFNYGGVMEIDLSKPPLQRYGLGQLKVTAILADITGSGGRTAIVEDATGRGYTVKKGTRIGNKNGVVVAIDEDKIHIIETIVDFTGKEKRFPRSLGIKKSEVDANVEENIRRNLE